MRIKHVLMDAAGAGDGTGGSAGGGAGGGAQAPWYQGVQGIDSEMIGHLTNKGWDKMSAADAAIAAAKAHREAQHFVGLPADQLLKLPKDASDAAGWDAVWQRLGVPKEAKDYDFSTIKRADGNPLDESFVNFMRDQASKNRLPKDAAQAIAGEFTKFQESAAQRDSADKAAKLAVEKTELAKNWGANFEANKFVAQRAAAALGVKPEDVAALEGVVGYSRIMEMFRSIGAKIGEDKFVTGGMQSSNGVMTRDQAQARLVDLKKDQGFVKKYLAGDTEAKREMEALHRIIAGTV